MTRSLGGAVRVLQLSILLLSSIGITPAQAASIPTTLQFTQIASGLTQPDFVTNAGDGSNRLFILQQTGQIRILKNGSLLSTPFLNLSGLVSNFTGANGEQGLLSLAFDPLYASTGIFYITYTTHTGNATFPYSTTLARYHVASNNPDVANGASGSVLLTIPKKYTNHNGGMLAFGPDGYLYMSMGDGGSGGDPDNNAQNIHTLLGKLLRLDVTTTPPAGQKYVIPSTNPFYNSSDSTIRKEIWAYGLRNPWRFSFDRSTGDLFIGDVGQNTEEEVDFQAAGSAGGQNYGWRVLEGNLCYSPSINCVPPPGYVAPVVTYDHGTNDSYGCSISGGYVYRGSRFPALQGVYFYGDFCSGKVLGLVRNGGTWSSSLIVSTTYNISSFGQDEQGGLYVVDYGGSIYQVGSPFVTISGSAGLSGVSLAYTDIAPKTAASDSGGSYSITVPQGWTGTVTPSLVCYVFNPASLSYSSIATNQSGQNYTPSLDPAAGCVGVDATIGSALVGSYYLPAAGSTRQSYVGTANGPVKISSVDGVTKLIAAKRSVSIQGGVYSSYSEMMGLPMEQLSSEYYFPWYNDTAPTLLVEQFRITNVDSADTMVEISVGSTVLGSYPLNAGAALTQDYPTLDNGPIRIRSTNGKKIVASLQARWLKGGAISSYAEMMGLPAEQLSSEYYFPWYNNAAPTLLDEQLRFGNVDTGPTTVQVYAGTTLLGSYDLNPGESMRQAYNVDNGPIRVKSTDGKRIIAAIRAVWLNGGVYSSYSELMGLPVEQLSSEYVLPWYNNTAPSLLDEQLRFGNVDTSATTIEVYSGTTLVQSFPDVAAGASIRVAYNIDSGPIRVKSTDGKKIIASIRAVWLKAGVYNSYSELMGLPVAQLSTEYWFPWYDFATPAQLDEQMRFGRP